MARDQRLPHGFTVGGGQLGSTASNQLLAVSLIGHGQPLDQTRLMGHCVRGNGLGGRTDRDTWPGKCLPLCCLVAPSKDHPELVLVGDWEDAEGNGGREV